MRENKVIESYHKLIDHQNLEIIEYELSIKIKQKDSWN